MTSATTGAGGTEAVVPRAPAAVIARSPFIRVAVTAVALIIWFCSNKLIGARGAPDLVAADLIRARTTSYLQAHSRVADL